MRRIQGRQGQANPSRHPRGHRRSGGDSWGSGSGAAAGLPASRPEGAPAASRWCSPAPTRFPRRTPAAAPPYSATWAAAARPASAAAPPATVRRRGTLPRRNAPPSAVTENPSSLYALLVRCGKRQYSRPGGQRVSLRQINSEMHLPFLSASSPRPPHSPDRKERSAGKQSPCGRWDFCIGS